MVPVLRLLPGAACQRWFDRLGTLPDQGQHSGLETDARWAVGVQDKQEVGTALVGEGVERPVPARFSVVPIGEADWDGIGDRDARGGAGRLRRR